MVAEIDGLVCGLNGWKRETDVKVSLTSEGPGTPGGRLIASVDPARCRVWEFHDRMEEYVTEESCSEELRSFHVHGQVVPALGRPVHGDPHHDVEIVCGARRLFIARRLGTRLRVEIREMSDRQALVAMDIENRHRKDISPYERGLTYQRWLHAKLFASQEDIARALKISASQVSRLLSLAQLPAVVVGAFSNPLELREIWGPELHRAIEDPNMRTLVLQRARALTRESPQIPAEVAYKRLLAPSGEAAKAGQSDRTKLVSVGGGRATLRVLRRRDGVAFMIPRTCATAEIIEQVRSAIAGILTAKDV